MEAKDDPDHSDGDATKIVTLLLYHVFQRQALLSLTIYTAAAAAAVDGIPRVRVSLHLPFAVVLADGALVSAN